MVRICLIHAIMWFGYLCRVNDSWKVIPPTRFNQRMVQHSFVQYIGMPLCTKLRLFLSVDPRLYPVLLLHRRRPWTRVTPPPRGRYVQHGRQTLWPCPQSGTLHARVRRRGLFTFCYSQLSARRTVSEIYSLFEQSAVSLWLYNESFSWGLGLPDRIVSYIQTEWYYFRDNWDWSNIACDVIGPCIAMLLCLLLVRSSDRARMSRASRTSGRQRRPGKSALVLSFHLSTHVLF